MPERRTQRRASRAKRQGKRPSTQAGEFVREEIEHVRRGKHGARNPQQMIAIGLSKARRAGIEVPPPKEGEASADTRRQAQRDLKKGRSKGRRRTSAKRSRATRGALEREGRSAGSRQALSRQAKRSSRRGRTAGASASTKARKSGGRRRTRTRQAAE